MKENQKNLDEKQTDVQKLMTAFLQKYQDQSNVSFAKTDPRGNIDRYRNNSSREEWIITRCFS